MDMPIAPNMNLITILRADEQQTQSDGKMLVTWNHSPVTNETLESYLDAVSKMRSIPYTVLEFPKGAPCNVVQAVRASMERHLACSKKELCFQSQTEDPYGYSIRAQNPE